MKDNIKSMIRITLCPLCSLWLILFLPGVTRAREEISLDQGWKFIRSDAPNASETAFDDSSWQGVDLPHTWNAELSFPGGPAFYRGVGWYRRHIKIDAGQLESKAFYIWFGAAGSAAEVFVNGQSAGTHKGAFAAFCFDIRSLLKAGDNVIAIRVTNAPDQSIAPLSGDFNMDGGLYRNAKLLITETLAVSPLDSGSQGVYVKQSKVTDDSAELEITTMLRNIEPADFNAKVTCTVKDAAGASVGSAEAIQVLMSSSDMPVTQKVTINNKPHLWNGRSDPYMYSVAVEVSDGTTTTDRVTVPIGLRYYRVDPQKGFSLNGKPYDLHGVNRHQDFGDKGWAITLADMQVDMALIKELGCTMLRLPHYQHSPLFYDLCDQNGLIVWAELCQVNSLGRSPEFADISKQQLTELIKQDFNHPAICFWGIYNELDFRGGDQDLKLLKDENDLAHELDSTRLTTAASNKRIDSPAHWIPDVIGLNVYYGWYTDQVPQDWIEGIARIVAFKTDHAIGISEYGAGGSIYQHEIPPRRPVTVSRWHPEEYQSYLHELAWKTMKDQPLWCRLIWTFADFPVANRREGDTLGFNDKGLVTSDRKTKKDAFYFYKSNWSDEPVVYVTSRRFTPRPQSATEFKIYSNCQSVELIVNGQSLGIKSAKDHVFVWENASLKLGANQVEASGRSADGKLISDSCTIVHDPAATTHSAS
jgi:beta-galactosidase